MPAVPDELKPVHAFWNTEACGTSFVDPGNDPVQFYANFREWRYRTEWHLLELVPFGSGAGKDVLEIGIGNGADGVMWAQQGARYTGLDLTEAAVTATRRHFDVLGLPGRFMAGNAEEQPFGDAEFDIIYSQGVLHHTADTQRSIDEVWRVLRPGGRIIIMLYHKHSFNYWVRIMTWMRLRVLLRILSRAGRWESDRAALNSAAATVQGVRGNEDRRVWDIHYQNWLREGWSYLSRDRFVHHCTDGPECPVAWAFSKSECRRLFSKFENLSFQTAHFPVKKKLRWFPLAIERVLARTMGWYLFIYGGKPAPRQP